MKIKAVAAKYGKSAGQTILRWQTQLGYEAIPKSRRKRQLKT